MGAQFGSGGEERSTKVLAQPVGGRQSVQGNRKGFKTEVGFRLQPRSSPWADVDQRRLEAAMRNDVAGTGRMWGLSGDMSLLTEVARVPTEC